MLVRRAAPVRVHLGAAKDAHLLLAESCESLIFLHTSRSPSRLCERFLHHHNKSRPEIGGSVFLINITAARRPPRIINCSSK